MRKRISKSSLRLRTYRVGYYLEEGFVVNVKARSIRDAERIIRQRLDDQAGEHDRSTRVHYADDITGTDEVRS